MDSIQYLLSIETRGIKLGLQRTRELMQACGNPQSGLPAIQVAGTNGKGSVSAMLSNILASAGYKTGLFTSPHLVHVNERIRINGEPIPDSKMISFIKSYKVDIETLEASFFESMTAMAFWYFKKEMVDIAILETGLGGRLDSVSVCEPMATVITPISLDHMEILGESLAEIAIEKAGAMKKDVVCISSNQKQEVKEILNVEAEKKRTPIRFINGEIIPNIKVGIPGKNQKENAQLAVTTLKELNGFSISRSAIERGLQSIKWYGRNQVISEEPLVIFDVAHNIDSITGFLDYYESLHIAGESILVLALQTRKRIQSLAPRLKSIFSTIICTEAGDYHPMSSSELSGNFKNLNTVKTINNPNKAILSGLDCLSAQGGMAIIGTHYLGPAVSTVFKISFDSI